VTATAVENRDHPGVLAKPPKIYLASIVAGAALEWLRPLPFAPAGSEPWLGLALLAAGIGLMAWAMRQFAQAKTNVPTDLPATTVVRSGPYRWSRNPIYLSLTLIHLGIACWLNGGWLLVSLAITLVVMVYGVIRREERYLEAKFGETYRAYRKEVRRWL
jgi:protein-S-isoprenylcysteine O-methyltransferase Ste14